jgi:hypothetical protein
MELLKTTMSRAYATFIQASGEQSRYQGDTDARQGGVVGRPSEREKGRSDTAMIVVAIVAVLLLASFFVVILPDDGSEPEVTSASLQREDVQGGYQFTFHNVTGEAHWDRLQIILATIKAGEDILNIGWTVPVDSLSSSVIPAVWEGGTYSNGVMDAALIVVDLLGDGMVNSGDYFSIVSETSDGFASGYLYIVEVMGNYLGSNDFGSLTSISFAA